MVSSGAERKFALVNALDKAMDDFIKREIKIYYFLRAANSRPEEIIYEISIILNRFLSDMLF